jgi:hypothetical protein
MIATRRFAHVLRTVTRALTVSAFVLAALALSPGTSDAIDLVRMEGLVRTPDAPGNVASLTLAIGDQSVPFSVLKAQKMSGNPATGPEIFSALGPGPPPLRIEGSDALVKQITDAKAGTRLTLTGNLDTANAFMTLMEVSAEPSAGAE